MNFTRFIIFLFVCLSLSPTIFSSDETLEIISPKYFNEQTNIYDQIHFLENELLSFNFCSESNPQKINFEIECSISKETTFLEVKDDKAGGKKQCYYSNYNLDEMSCPEFSLKIKYEINNKEKIIKRDFKKQRQSKLINYVLSEDINSLTPLDLSYYLIVSNEVENKESKLSNDAYDKLKNERHNSNKCWPKDSCTLIETTKILRNLKMASYGIDTRLLEDGKNYLEKNSISNDNTPLRFTITLDHEFNSSEEISCDLTIDDENPRTYLFDENSTIDKVASNTIKFTCEKDIDEIEFMLYDIEGLIQKGEFYEETNTFTYNIEEFACITLGTTCAYKENVNTLITYENKIEGSTQIQNFLETKSNDFGSEKYIDTEQRIEDSGKQIYLKKDNEIIDYIKFAQNNDGSWGSNSRYDRILQTSWAIIGLQKSDLSSEYTEDGKKWIYFNEPINGWGDTEKNTLAFLAIKEQIKPYIKINSKNEIKDQSKFLIENPTIYKLKNIEINFDEDLEKELSYLKNIGDLEGEDSLIFNVSVNNDFFGQVTGNMYITGIDGKNQKINLITMPVSIKGSLPFDLKIHKNYSISIEDPTIKIELEHNINSYDIKCNYINPFNNIKSEIELKHTTWYLEIKNSQLINGTFNTTLYCDLNNDLFEIPIKSNINIAKEDFEIIENKILIKNGNDFSINIHSLAKDKITILMEVSGDFKGIVQPVEKYKIIAKNDTRELFFSISDEKLLSSIGDNPEGELIIKSKIEGYTKKIPLYYNSNPEPESVSILNIILIIFSTVIILFVLLVIFRFFQLKREEYLDSLEENNPQDEDDEEFHFDEDIKFE